MTNAMFERMKPLPFTAPMAIAARLVLLVCGVSGLAGAALADERSDGVTPRIVLAPQAPLARGAEIARAVVYLEAEEADVSLTPGSSLVSPILLRVQGPVFGWLGESEPYPDRHFPELRFSATANLCLIRSLSALRWVRWISQRCSATPR